MTSPEPIETVASHPEEAKSLMEAARRRIADAIHRTPIVQCSTVNDRTGARVFLKCENQQKTGSFKIRGATNAVRSLSDSDRQRGLATHSSGNHAAALARSAQQMGATARIVMPNNSPAVKVAAVRHYGAEITFCEPTAPARQEALQKILAATGACMVHPYDDDRIIAGQASCAAEILDQLDAIDVVIVPVGGGGLASGTALTIKAYRPQIKVVLAEPAWADDASRSLTSQRLQTPTRHDTIADGLRTGLSSKTFTILRSLADDLRLVSEAAIVEATLLLLQRAKLMVEPSAAVPLAVLLEHPEVGAGKNVAVILSGGNIDLFDFTARAATIQ